MPAMALSTRLPLVRVNAAPILLLSSKVALQAVGRLVQMSQTKICSSSCRELGSIVSAKSSHPHLKGHQLGLKLCGTPASCPPSVVCRLPAAAAHDVAAMHTDGYDKGFGTIVYLNDRAPIQLLKMSLCRMLILLSLVGAKVRSLPLGSARAILERRPLSGEDSVQAGLCRGRQQASTH
eukprot:5879518-Pleurochrysis_carterae.AAC.1